MRYKMTGVERAKQFAPFDALNGLGEALAKKEAEFCMVKHHELSADELTAINDELALLCPGMPVFINYYRDGAYHDFTGPVKKVDTVRKILEFDELSVPFVDIRRIDRDVV